MKFRRLMNGKGYGLTTRNWDITVWRRAVISTGPPSTVGHGRWRVDWYVWGVQEATQGAFGWDGTSADAGRRTVGYARTKWGARRLADRHARIAYHGRAKRPYDTIRVVRNV